MTAETNELGQPVGEVVADWSGALPPPESTMEGRFCRLEPLVAANHAGDLFDAFAADRDGALWTYMSWGPFADVDELAAWIRAVTDDSNLQYYAIVERTSGKALGKAAYLRIKPEAGAIEVGGIALAPALQRTSAATEAMYLMMQRVFDELAYRRYEWKCDTLNAASRRAAERLGFSFEGIFRQALVVKGRNRDTAWYAMLDHEWPRIARAFRDWLEPENFDAAGAQRRSLQAASVGEA